MKKIKDSTQVSPVVFCKLKDEETLKTTEMPGREGIRSVRRKVTKWKDCFWVLFIFPVEGTPGYITAYMCPALSRRQAEDQAELFTAWILNPDLYEFFDQTVFTAATKQEILELMSLEDV